MGEYYPTATVRNHPYMSVFTNPNNPSDPLKPTRLRAGYSKRAVWAVLRNVVQPYLHLILNTKKYYLPIIEVASKEKKNDDEGTSASLNPSSNSL
jgi:hypothetical protein